ncbi:MAG: phosphotyrosine protein phosphatase [Chryseobacterium sp. 39-10]|nr:MAG: phosphotyrosine protein phosphatase [Chryseobacterium sp. 39-10]
MKKILFVCSANKQRSKTAEDYFSENFSEFEFYSAGTNLKLCEKAGTNPLTKKVLENADLIFVMESKHKNEINKLFGNDYTQKIEILNIPDKYKYYQKELIEIIKTKVKNKIL